jgi:hypothetical protein
MTEKDLWDEIPSMGLIALGRRGMEKIDLSQCFIPGCENQDINMLKPIKKEETENDEKLVQTYSIHCEKCNKTFKLSFETFKKVARKKGKSNYDDKEDSEDILSMGLIYVFDDRGKKLHLGFF